MKNVLQSPLQLLLYSVAQALFLLLFIVNQDYLRLAFGLVTALGIVISLCWWLALFLRLFDTALRSA